MDNRNKSSEDRAQELARIVTEELAYTYETGYSGAQMQEAVRQTLLTAIQPLIDELERKDEALRRVMAETGTSSLAHHAARDAL